MKLWRIMGLPEKALQEGREDSESFVRLQVDFRQIRNFFWVWEFGGVGVLKDG